MLAKNEIKKVAHVIPSFYPVRGGIETLLHLARPRLEDLYGVESIALAPQFSIMQPDIAEIDGLRTHLIPVPGDRRDVASPAVIASYFALIRRVLESESVDLVHVHGPYSLFHTAPKVARSMGLPLVHHLHGELAETLDSSTKIELSRASKVLAVSGAVAQSMKRHFPESDPIVLPNGIEELPIATRDHSTSEFVIALVGRMDATKGFDYALRAISLVKKRGIKVRIHIVGIGDIIYINSLLQKLDLSEETYFHGRSSRAKVIELMRSSMVLVASSVQTEGFSLVAAEAGGVGLPVIAFDTGGLAETVVDEVTGILVPNRDIESLAKALERYAREPKLRTTHGDNAVRHVRDRFSLDLFVSRLMIHYHEAYSRE